jgi:hypothetical protein
VGLRWSMENILGWRSQYQRMERWLGRIAVQAGSEADHDLLDMYLAFFLNCYSLRDWFVKSGVIAEADIDELIQRSRQMRLCRDLCNRSKHLRISRPSTDADFSIIRAYRGPYRSNGPDYTLAIIAEDAQDIQQTDLWDVAHGCARFWSDFIRARKPPEPTNPFDRSATGNSTTP